MIETFLKPEIFMKQLNLHELNFRDGTKFHKIRIYWQFKNMTIYAMLTNAYVFYVEKKTIMYWIKKPTYIHFVQSRRLVHNIKNTILKWKRVSRISSR